MDATFRSRQLATVSRFTIAWPDKKEEATVYGMLSSHIVPYSVLVFCLFCGGVWIRRETLTAASPDKIEQATWYAKESPCFLCRPGFCRSRFWPLTTWPSIGVPQSVLAADLDLCLADHADTLERKLTYDTPDWRKREAESAYLSGHRAHG